MNPVVEVDMPEGELVVVERDDGFFDVKVGGVVRHPKSTAEDVMRALGNYINSLSYRLSKAEGK